MKKTYEPPKVTPIPTPVSPPIRAACGMESCGMYECPSCQHPGAFSRYWNGNKPLDLMDPKEAIRFLLAHHFLLVDVWTDVDAQDQPIDHGYEFGVAPDVPAGMDLLAVAFRCNESTGASLVVCSIGSPKFVHNEIETALECSNMVRYLLIVSASTARVFAELLSKDLMEADIQADMVRDSTRTRLETFVRNQMVLWASIGAVELAIACIIAAMGLYFHTFERGSNVALWGMLPLASIMLYRFVHAAVNFRAALKKFRQSDSK